MSQAPAFNEAFDRSLYEAVSLWTGIGSALALIVAWSHSGVLASGILISWVAGHSTLALVAGYLTHQSKRAVRPAYFRAQPAHLTMLASVLLWSFGVLLFSGHADYELNLPIFLVASGLACASVWLLSGDLVLIAGTQMLLLMPMLYRLLAGNNASLAAATLFLLLVIANALISRRLALGSSVAPDAAIIPAIRASNSSRAAADTDTARFQNERLVGELNAELARHKNISDELKSAKLAAEAASMAKGEFLAMMSHEIRTPLNGIIPLLEILRDSKLQPDQREYLNTAYSSSKQLLGIIDDILDYSKIEANKLELEQVGLNLREVVDSVMRLMERPAANKKLKISLQLDAGVRVAMRGDPTRLRQVLTNLVSNAVKFTERGGIVVQIQKRSETRTHQELTFAIKDTGVGISPEGQLNLFKPFQQADNSTTRVFGGTGLGLVICKRIIDLMGGQIGVKSELGKGSIFWFTVSMLKAVGDIGSSRRDLTGIRALIVSSEPRLSQRLNSTLGGQGMTLTMSDAAADAFSKLKSSSSLGDNWAFDLAVLDLTSLRSSAPSFVRGILREPALERVKLLLLQSHEAQHIEGLDPRRYMAVAANISDGELSGTLNRLLEVQESSERRFSLLEDAALLGGNDAAEAIPSLAKVSSPVLGHALIVEDNPVNRTVAARVVGLIGLSIEIAENGKEALDKMNESDFDIVLMDCQMPVMDGYTSTRTRRTLEDERKLKRLPIIAMTANAMVGDREKCLASGMDDYLSKPLNRMLLEQTLRKWLPPDARTRPEFLPASARQAALAEAAAVPMVSSYQTTNPLNADDFGAELAQAAAMIPDFGAPSASSEVLREPLPIPPAQHAVAVPAMAALSSKPAIDRSVFDELLDIMGSEFAALVKVYLEDTPKNLRILLQAGEAGDIKAMVAPSHSLKSTSANLGALGLSDISKKIEHDARNGKLTDPLGHARAAANEFRRAAAELNALLGQMP